MVKPIVFYIFLIIMAFYNLDIDLINIKIVFFNKNIYKLFYLKYPKSYYKD